MSRFNLAAPKPVAPPHPPQPEAAPMPVEETPPPGPVPEAAPAPSPGLTFDLARLKLSLTMAVTHKPGADLSLLAYPLLVYAPGQHGPGVRTEDKGIPVVDIVARVAEMPDYDRLAETFGTTKDHVSQAIAYAVAAGTPKPGT